MRITRKKRIRSAFPAVVAVVSLLGGITTVAVMNAIIHPTAHLGDIVAFTTAGTETGTADVRLLVHRQDRFGCVLDINVMRRSGGSLIVESQVGSGRNFRVHWAGARTTDDTASCGEQADLIVGSGDLDTLARAAGGSRAGRTRTPLSAGTFGDVLMPSFRYVAPPGAFGSGR